MPETRSKRLPILAVDLGGTKIAAALISPDNRIIDRAYSLTLAGEGLQPVTERIFATIDRLLSAHIEGIAIAAAGAIDTDKGLITLSPNLPGWLNVPLRDMVRKQYGVATYLLNDAKAAALGEHRLGAGKGANNLIYITVGTGIGGGIIVNGELYSGALGNAGELGHMTIDVNGPKCNCGNIGCLEVFASGTALASEARRRIKDGEKSRLTDIVHGDLGAITAEKVGEAAHGGDRLAQEVISRAATYLGVGMVNLVNIFNPEMIIVGGGLAKMGELFLEPAREVVRKRAFSLGSRAVCIVVSKLGDDAGVLGAAIFARQQLGSGSAKLSF
jgi:glucokinase